VVTEFSVLHAFKGAITHGQTLRVRQFQPRAIPAQTGEIVLWYLKTGDSTAGDVFDTPVGRYSGDFRTVLGKGSSGEHELTFVENQVGNRGLWSSNEGASLWNKTTFQRSIAEAYFVDFLKRADPKLAEDEGVLKKRVRQVLDFGEFPCKPRALPLEFVMAATNARLSVQP
jgi:hypothetical protein